MHLLPAAQKELKLGLVVGEIASSVWSSARSHPVRSRRPLCGNRNMYLINVFAPRCHLPNRCHLSAFYGTSLPMNSLNNKDARNYYVNSLLDAKCG